MLNTMSKLRGQVKATGYPQTEGLLGDCMLKYGKELGEESAFGGYPQLSWCSGNTWWALGFPQNLCPCNVIMFRYYQNSVFIMGCVWRGCLESIGKENASICNPISMCRFR